MQEQFRDYVSEHVVSRGDWSVLQLADHCDGRLKGSPHHMKRYDKEKEAYYSRCILYNAQDKNKSIMRTDPIGTGWLK